MMNARIGLILTGLAFGIWEAVDIFWIDVPAIAAVFAALFLGCTLWFWRRDSVRAAVALLVLFAFEAAAAPEAEARDDPDEGRGLHARIAGVTCAIAVLVAERRAKRRAVVAWPKPADTQPPDE